MCNITPIIINLVDLGQIHKTSLYYRLINQTDYIMTSYEEEKHIWHCHIWKEIRISPQNFVISREVFLNLGNILHLEGI